MLKLIFHFRTSQLRKWIRRSLLALGIALLGFVGYSLLDAKVFQAYENWRFNRDLNSSRPSVATAEPELLPASQTPAQILQHAVARGDVLGRIEISRIGIAVVIIEGVDGKSLRRGVGHVPGSALPGGHGNIALAGHRDTFFRDLRNIRQDDQITLSTLAGSYEYQVDSIRIVAENEIQVLEDSGDSVLTLVTCYPFYYVGPAPRRFIVRAHRI
jgi:sortase A